MEFEEVVKATAQELHKWRPILAEVLSALAQPEVDKHLAVGMFNGTITVRVDYETGRIKYVLVTPEFKLKEGLHFAKPVF